ncbi:hypothetical protein [Pseudomonas phage PhL_UNISO_PA-DSM_ph0041x]|nr:hypothetical protein [Pseudomonas phage PhL_UNISO_PA-DSM_ph0041x]
MLPVALEPRGLSIDYAGTGDQSGLLWYKAKTYALSECALFPQLSGFSPVQSKGPSRVHFPQVAVT